MISCAKAIEADLVWREKELASLKRFAIQSRLNQIAYASALRALWAMLYAHFEGFTKFCWESVLDEIQQRAIRRADLRECVATLSLGHVFAGIRGDTSSAALWKALRVDLPYHLNEVAEFQASSRLDTNSNLWPSLFREQNQRLGIDCQELDRNEVRIKALVSRRNKIAHGESMTIKSLDEYQPYEDATVLLMHELALTCIDYVESARYLK